MKCNYPLCPRPAMWLPVISIPCIRTVGVEKPELSHLVHDQSAMRKFGLDPAQHIRMYEDRLKEWKQSQNTLAHTDQPTILLGREVCEAHRLTYKFLDWFGVVDWEALLEAARSHNVVLDSVSITVQFKPVGWEPGVKYMERER